MPMKGSGAATDYREIDRDEHGVGWIAYPDETMQRASHAIEIDGDLWVCDPVDAEGLDDLLAEFGDLTGVVVLLDRHKRDGAAVANRHDVSVHVPRWMDGVATAIDAPTERVSRELPGTDARVHRLLDNRFWQEAVLQVPSRNELVVPESVGTADYFLAGRERLGVHPMVRLRPPRKLREFSPDRIRVGHGSGLAEDASGALADALSGARSRTPGLYVKNLKNLVFG